MAIRPDWNIGTITLIEGSDSFTTANALLNLSAAEAGDTIITPSGDVLIISAITGQNSGTLFLPCPPSAAGADQPLRIRFQPDGSRYQGAIRDLMARWGQNGNVDAFAGLEGVDGQVPIFTGGGTMGLADFSAVKTTVDDVEARVDDAEAAINNRVRFDGDQALTEQQQGQARLNINAQQAGGILEAFRSASGAEANQLPYMTGVDSAAFTTLTPFARTILDDSSGSQMFESMGAASSVSFASNGYAKLPNGLLIQWVSISPATDVTLLWPTSFATELWVGVAGLRYFGLATTHFIGVSLEAVQGNPQAYTVRRRLISGGSVSQATNPYPIFAIAVGEAP